MKSIVCGYFSRQGKVYYVLMVPQKCYEFVYICYGERTEKMHYLIWSVYYTKQGVLRDHSLSTRSNITQGKIYSVLMVLSKCYGFVFFCNGEWLERNALSYLNNVPSQPSSNTRKKTNKVFNTTLSILLMAWTPILQLSNSILV